MISLLFWNYKNVKNLNKRKLINSHIFFFFLNWWYSVHFLPFICLITQKRNLFLLGFQKQVIGIACIRGEQIWQKTFKTIPICYNNHQYISKLVSNLINQTDSCTVSNKSKVTCKKKGHVANKDLYCHGLVNIAMEISFFTLACRMTDDTSNKTKATCL
jgi:hypothetical protein